MCCTFLPGFAYLAYCTQEISRIHSHFQSFLSCLLHVLVVRVIEFVSPGWSEVDTLVFLGL